MAIKSENYARFNLFFEMNGIVAGSDVKRTSYVFLFLSVIPWLIPDNCS